jgi:hypothetical protein
MSIDNAHLVLRVFGVWPSFHDAEIHSISMNQEGPTMDVVIHHWTMTDQIDAKGSYILKNHTLTTFRFFEFSELDLKWFAFQNVLQELEIVESPTPPHFTVHMPSSVGCEASFKCARVGILSSTPHTPTV